MMLHVGFRGSFNYKIGDEVVVKVNGRVFGKSVVTEKPEGKDLIGIRLDEQSVRYVEQYINEGYSKKIGEPKIELVVQ